MIIYCSKCRINWARLWSQDDDLRDESFDHCPECKTDKYLQEGTDITAYIKCPISGRIKNVDTGVEIHAEHISTAPLPHRKKVYDESYEEFQLRMEQAEDDWVAARRSGNAVAKGKPIRKFHWENIN